MNFARRHQRLGRWLAQLALAVLVLLPTLGHALASGGGGFAEVCTPQGLKLVPLDSGETLPSPATHLEHCTFCVAAVAPPPAVLAAPVLPPLAAEVPALFLHAPHTLHAWASPRPRGPPAFID